MKRKSIIFSIVLLVSFTATLAQTPHIESHNLNLKNKNLEGTWVWKEGNNSISLKLKNEKTLVGLHNKSYANLLIGYILYKKDNIIIQDSYKYADANPEKVKPLIMGRVGDQKPYTYTGSLWDKNKNKSCRLTLTLSEDGETLEWNLKEHPGGYIVGTREEGFSFPLNLVLTKQEDEKK